MKRKELITRPPDNVMRWKSIVEKNKYPDIRADLVLAQIWQESSGNRYAYRFEPGYSYFYDFKAKRALHANWKSEEANREFALQELGATEFHAQSASWGLLQIMGAVAREYGFGGSMPELGDPELNIRLGTKYLWVYGFRAGKLSTEHALRRYNGSGPAAEKYMAEVLQKYSLIG